MPVPGDAPDRLRPVANRIADQHPAMLRAFLRSAAATVVAVGFTIGFADVAAASDPLLPGSDDLRNAVTDTSTASTDTVAPALAPVIDTLEPGTAPVVEIVEPAVEPVAATLEPVVNGVEPVLEPVIAATASVTDQLVSTVAPVADALAPTVATLDGAVAPLTQPLAPVMDALVTPLDDSTATSRSAALLAELHAMLVDAPVADSADLRSGSLKTPELRNVDVSAPTAPVATVFAEPTCFTDAS